MCTEILCFLIFRSIKLRQDKNFLIEVQKMSAFKKLNKFSYTLFPSYILLAPRRAL